MADVVDRMRGATDEATMLRIELARARGEAEAERAARKDAEASKGGLMIAVNAISKELDATKDRLSDLAGDLKVEKALHTLTKLELANTKAELANTKLELAKARSWRRIVIHCMVGVAVAVVAAFAVVHFFPAVLPWIGLAKATVVVVSP